MSSKIDIGLKIYDAVRNILTISGLERETAKKYAYFATELYDYIEECPELQTALQGARSIYDGAGGVNGYLAASNFANKAKALGAVKAAEKLAAKGIFSAGAAISAFVDYFTAIAQGLNIEMDECAISVTKVMLDVLATIALADTLVGFWAAALQILATEADTKGMIRACGISF